MASQKKIETKKKAEILCEAIVAETEEKARMYPYCSDWDSRKDGKNEKASALRLSTEE